MLTPVGEYGHEMPTVYLRADPKGRSRFHRDPGCRQLTKLPPKGEAHQLLARPLEEVDGRPCGTCYPDAPRVKIHKRYCAICMSRYACEHNGGIQVISRGRPFVRRIWVWPDQNRFRTYDIAN